MSFLRFLGLEPAKASAEGDTRTVRRIVEQLESMEPERARYLAAFAFILSRVAHADAHVSDEETRGMEQTVMRFSGLTPAQAVLVVQMAKSQATVFGETENFLVTRQFKGMSTPEEREELLHALFAVSAADDSISSVEESHIRQIATELGLNDRDFLAVRSRYSDKRAVMKNLPGGS